jgi:hypothetical protein
MDNMFFDRIIQVVQQHKLNSIEILDKHKMLPKRKAPMNIPMCRMISMLVIDHALKIDVLEMEQEFHTRYHKGDNVFYVSPLNWKGVEEFLDSYVDS